MRETRTNKEHLIDQLLMLKLLNAMEQQNKRDDGFQQVMNVMKAAFAAAWDMFWRKVKGFNLVFFTYKHGPFSRDLYAVCNSLITAGLVEETRIRSRLWWPRAYRLTTKGRTVLSESQELLRLVPNQALVQTVEEAAKEIAPLAWWQARDWSHQIKVIPPKGWNLRAKPAQAGESKAVSLVELPRNQNLVAVLDEDEATSSFELDDDWYDTLEILFSPDYDPEAMRQPSDKTYEELFAGV